MFSMARMQWGYWEMATLKESVDKYNCLLGQVSYSMDFPSQQIPRIQFLTECQCGVRVADTQSRYGSDELVHPQTKFMKCILKRSLFIYFVRTLKKREACIETGLELAPVLIAFKLSFEVLLHHLAAYV